MRQIETLEDLADLSDEELWEVAASRRNMAEIRYAAMEQWLRLEDMEAADIQFKHLKRRATRLEADELDEYEFEDKYNQGIYFDDEGRLIVEHDGVQYAVEPSGEPGSL